LRFSGSSSFTISRFQGVVLNGLVASGFCFSSAASVEACCPGPRRLLELASIDSPPAPPMGLKDLFRKRDDGRADAAEVDALVARLADPDWNVRLEACRALGRMGRRAERAAPALQELITDDNGDVCNAAAAALSEIER